MFSSVVRFASVAACMFVSAGILAAPAQAQTEGLKGHTDNESQVTMVLQYSHGVVNAEPQVKGVIGGAYVSDWYADGADFDLTYRFIDDSYGEPVTATFSGSTQKCQIAPAEAHKQYICGFEWKGGEPTVWVVDIYA